MAASPSPDSLPGLAVLEQTPIIIEKIVWSATDEQLHWKPATDRWSISEVLAHLAEAEVVGFRERVQIMMEKDNPRLEAYEEPIHVVEDATGVHTESANTLNLPQPYATGNDSPGGVFRISVDGTVLPNEASFTSSSSYGGRMPTTLVVGVPLAMKNQTVQAMWHNVRGSTVIVDSPSTLSAIY